MRRGTFGVGLVAFVLAVPRTAGVGVGIGGPPQSFRGPAPSMTAALSEARGPAASGLDDWAVP